MKNENVYRTVATPTVRTIIGEQLGPQRDSGWTSR